MGPTEKTTQDVVRWLDSSGDAIFGQTTRMYKTAIVALQSTIQATEPNTIDWFLENIEMLAERLNVADSSRKTYISKSQSAIRAFLAPPSKADQYLKPNIPEKTFQEEVSEAIRAIAQWPSLQRYLMGAILEALQDHEKTEKNKESST